MAEKFYKNEKFQNIFFPSLLFVLVIGTVISFCFAFVNQYFQPIIVDGTSMMPTLIGGSISNTIYNPSTDETANANHGDDGKDYSNYVNLSYRYYCGNSDNSEKAINNLERFDVVVTYYPDRWIHETEPTYKIKRVWGFPKERIVLDYSEDKHEFTFGVYHENIAHPVEEYKAEVSTKSFSFYTEYLDNQTSSYKYKTIKEEHNVATFVTNKKTFNVMGDNHRHFDLTLGDDEYFVMGDNWLVSSDSYSYVVLNFKPNLTKSDIQGRVAYFDSVATSVIGVKDPVRKVKIDKIYNF